MARKPRPGEPPANRLGVYDADLNLRGHVGRTATAATASRFTGKLGAVLGKHPTTGKPAWLAPKKPKE